MYDLAVIGGGPAGSAAAITAACSGARVLLLERGRFPRHKVCGEFVSAESLALLSSLLTGTPHSRLLERAPHIQAGRLFVDNRVLSAPIHPAAASISRYEMDESLWQAAVQAGVDARQQYAVAAITGTGPFTMLTAEGTFEARSLINASGRWSNLSDRPSVSDRDGARWIGLKAHYVEPRPSPAVDLYFFEGGYCGVQPINGSGDINVCAMVRSDLATNLAEVWERHPALRMRSQAWQPTTEAVSTAPLIFKTPQPSSGNILFAGDAAGFVDPFVGDGISLALRSGALAARCLRPFLEGNLPLSRATAAYDECYTRQLRPVFHTSSKIRRLFALPRPARTALLALFENAPALTRYLVRKTRETS